jgi:2-C-methyl-D-erythritol 2,4-cyclodiphosphate synthase
MFRVGMGYDIHRFKKGRTLWLGGVKIPFALGLEGHSDADALLHAITDAILGAAGLPEIGSFFPPGDPETKNIPSSHMLAQAVQEMEKQGYQIVNVDTVVLTESPRLAPYRELMRKTIARLLKISAMEVQVKGKTHEQLDAIGAGKALAAQAVVLLQKRVNQPISHE